MSADFGGASATTALFSVGGVLSLPSSKDADTGLVSGISGSFGGWLCIVISSREMIATDTAFVVIFFFNIDFSLRHKKLTTVIELFLKTVAFVVLQFSCQLHSKPKALDKARLALIVTNHFEFINNLQDCFSICF